MPRLPWNKAKLYKAGINEDLSGKKAHQFCLFLSLFSTSFPFCETGTRMRGDGRSNYSVYGQEEREESVQPVCDFFLHVFVQLLLTPGLAVNHGTDWRTGGSFAN